ncbi:MAG: chromate transporter [Spirochaetaceae bacterium]|nr:MAG: chromate transporter [Spirochaetaceae bacterium]
MSTTPAAKPDSKTSMPSLWGMFAVFFRTGLLTFGGGYSILPVLHYELVDKRHWLSELAFTDIISRATAIPGAISVSAAFLCGRLLRGKKGSAAAVLGMTIPSITTMIIIAAFLFDYAQHPPVQRFMKGAAAAVTAQITYGVWLYARSAVRSIWVILAAVPLFAGVAFLGVHPLLVVAASLLVGGPLVYRKAQLKAAHSFGAHSPAVPSPGDQSPESEYSKLME